jgi:hypothetical protein
MSDRDRLILIARAKQKQAQEAAAKSTNLVEQVGTGTSEGIAGMAGLPVDILTKGINAVGGMAGMSPIQKPVGGSESIKGLLDPFMSDVEPQNAVQRIGRRVGQDVGSGVVAAPLAGASSLGAMGLNTATDVASGLAGGATSEVTDDPTMNVIASLLAGGGVIAGAKAGRPGPQAPSNEELKQTASGLYDQAENSPFRLSQRGGQILKGNVSARMYDDRMKPSLHPEAAAGVDEVWEMGDRPSLWDLEQTRRFVGRNSIPTDPNKVETARLGLGIRQEIDDFIDQAAPNHPDVGALKDARDTSRRYIASEKLDRAIDKAERRTQSTGTGGNTINTPRQNLNGILNNPKEAASFTPAEQQQMREIIAGKGGTNGLRMAASLSPDRGGLPLMLSLAGAGGAGAGIMSGNPALAMASAAPAGIGYIAKLLGEHLTDKQIQRLSETIRNGGVPVGPKLMSDGEKSVLAALLAGQTANATQQ